jgi:ABC-2 type transport system permease protein
MTVSVDDHPGGGTAAPSPDSGTPAAAEPDRTEALRALLATHRRSPRAPGVLASVRATSWRSLLKIKHTPEQLFDVTGFPVIMILLFTFLFGGAIAGSPGEYVQFVLPGLMTMSLLLTTIYTGMTINVDMRTGVFDRFRTLPIWRPAPMVGYLVADLCRYLIAAVVMLGVGLLLGYRPGAGVLGVLAGIALVLVFCFAFSWVWTALGLMARSEKTVLSVSMALLFPLAFLSNILVEPATMPGWLAAAVGLSPITFLVTAVRGLMDGSPDGFAIVWTLVWAAAILVVFGALSMRAYNRR